MFSSYLTKTKSKSKKEDQNIIYLKKNNIIIYYHKIFKYPLMVIELFNDAPYNCGIKRSNMGEPFKPDDEIPFEYQHSIQDYIECSKKGYSYGHNAAAFIHKDSVENYKSTYLFSNICPQEVVFNSGLWLLFEGISENILNKYKNGMIINGSISGKTKIFNNVQMNIPSYMYKIILYKKDDDKTYYLCFVAKNKPYYIDQDIVKYKNKPYSLSQYTMNLDMFQKKFGLTLLSKNNTFEKSNEDFIVANSSRIGQMKNASLYGHIIYSKSLQELKRVAPDFDKLPDFHKIYYQYKIEEFSKHPNQEKMNSIIQQSMSNPIF